MNSNFFNLLFLLFSLLFFTFCKKEEVYKNNSDSINNNPTNGKSKATFNPSINYNAITDQDSNIYKIVEIGSQTWMAENLRTTKYNDGLNIPHLTDRIEWQNSTNGAYCNYKNTNSVDTIATFGRLYNFYAINTDKLCPIGWHVATDEDWTTLTNFIGGENIAGAKLKEKGTTHWELSSYNASTNEVGFTALPGGFRVSGDFYNLGSQGFWWTSTKDTNSASYWYRNMFFNYSLTYRATSPDKNLGLSVRCVKN